MKSRISRLSTGISSTVITALLIAGCNPYHSEFTCRNAPFGSCAKTPDIYDTILERDKLQKVGVSRADSNDSGKSKEVVLNDHPRRESAYLDAEMQKATSLLKQPVTPIVVPPAVGRILFFPFEGADGELNMPSWTYIMLDKQKWLMGDYLNDQSGVGQ